MLTVDELREEVERGSIDTVVAALPDMQGRLMGKRFHARFFLEMAVRYAGMKTPPMVLPSGYGALLYLFRLR